MSAATHKQCLNLIAAVRHAKSAREACRTMVRILADEPEGREIAVALEAEADRLVDLLEERAQAVSDSVPS